MDLTEYDRLLAAHRHAANRERVLQRRLAWARRRQNALWRQASAEFDRQYARSTAFLVTLLGK